MQTWIDWSRSISPTPGPRLDLGFVWSEWSPKLWRGLLGSTTLAERSRFMSWPSILLCRATHQWHHSRTWSTARNPHTGLRCSHKIPVPQNSLEGSCNRAPLEYRFYLCLAASVLDSSPVWAPCPPKSQQLALVFPGAGVDGVPLPLLSLVVVTLQSHPLLGRPCLGHPHWSRAAFLEDCCWSWTRACLSVKVRILTLVVRNAWSFGVSITAVCSRGTSCQWLMTSRQKQSGSSRLCELQCGVARACVLSDLWSWHLLPNFCNYLLILLIKFCTNACLHIL